uniref:Uncharacterized protein n=1 Tax=Sarcophilus harrisii TaxID=9305 RepID=A0A7N4NZL3_SARHA
SGLGKRAHWFSAPCSLLPAFLPNPRGPPASFPAPAPGWSGPHPLARSAPPSPSFFPLPLPPGRLHPSSAPLPPRPPPEIKAAQPGRQTAPYVTPSAERPGHGERIGRESRGESRRGRARVRVRGGAGGPPRGGARPARGRGPLPARRGAESVRGAGAGGAPGAHCGRAAERARAFAGPPGAAGAPRGGAGERHRPAPGWRTRTPGRTGVPRGPRAPALRQPRGFSLSGRGQSGEQEEWADSEAKRGSNASVMENGHQVTAGPGHLSPEAPEPFESHPPSVALCMPHQPVTAITRGSEKASGEIVSPALAGASVASQGSGETGKTAGHAEKSFRVTRSSSVTSFGMSNVFVNNESLQQATTPKSPSPPPPAVGHRQGERRRELVRSQTLPRTSGAQARKALFEKWEQDAGKYGTPRGCRAPPPGALVWPPSPLGLTDKGRGQRGRTDPASAPTAAKPPTEP